VKLWQKILIPTLVSLLIGGIYLLVVFHQRSNPGAIAGRNAPEPVTQDDLANVRTLSASHYEDLQQLASTSVWMKNGYTITYFPATAAGVIDFKHAFGLMPSLAKLDVQKIAKAAVPATVEDGMGHGTKQVFILFTQAATGKQLFALPMGAIDGADEAYYPDLLFFYDDPHTIYSHWGPEVWKSVDAHQVVKGMSELQTRLAVGQKMHPDSPREGDRTVTYDQAGKKWTVIFEGDRATSVQGPV
jgi:hypothetical protein